jgi:hypothetical protein
MTSRSANASILGYRYQFDKSIIELLKRAPTETITLEGIEDIDLNTPLPTSVQCKYYSAQRYQPSLLREPLQAMLLHQQHATAPRQYLIYLHCKENTPQTTLTTDALKSILTYTEQGARHVFHDEHGITDHDLDRFLQFLTIEPAKAFEEQRREVLRTITTALSCTLIEAEDFYYPRALDLIFTTATKPTQQERTISPASFLVGTRTRDILFTIWHHDLLDKERTTTYHKKLLKQTRALLPTNQRLLLLTDATINRDTAYTLHTLITTLTNHAYRLGHALYNAKPWTVAADLTPAGLDTLKRSLLNDGIAYNDGHEALGFFPPHFTKDPIINRTTTKHGKPTDRISAASYTVRLVSTTTLRMHATTIPLDVLITTDNNPITGLPAQQTIHIGEHHTLADLATLLT